MIQFISSLAYPSAILHKLLFMSLFPSYNEEIQIIYDENEGKKKNQCDTSTNLAILLSAKHPLNARPLWLWLYTKYERGTAVLCFLTCMVVEALNVTEKE